MYPVGIRGFHHDNRVLLVCVFPPLVLGTNRAAGGWAEDNARPTSLALNYATLDGLLDAILVVLSTGIVKNSLEGMG